MRSNDEAVLSDIKTGHHNEVIMSAIASQITSVLIVYSTVCLGADQRKHQSSASLTFLRGIHRWLVNSPHKGLVTRKKCPFDDFIMYCDVNSWDSFWVAFRCDESWTRCVFYNNLWPNNVLSTKLTNLLSIIVHCVSHFGHLVQENHWHLEEQPCKLNSWGSHWTTSSTCFDDSASRDC